MRRTRAAVARPLHDVAERDARLRLARPPARGATTELQGFLGGLLGLGFGESPRRAGDLVPDSEGGGTVVDDDGGGRREAGEVGLPPRAGHRRHLGGGDGGARRRRGRRRVRGFWESCPFAASSSSALRSRLASSRPPAFTKY